jgi:hypothetical protein
MVDNNKMQSLPSNLKDRKYTREELKCFRECLRKAKRRGDGGDDGDGGDRDRGIPQIVGRGLSQPFAQSMHVPLVVAKPSARATFEQPRFQDLRPRRRERRFGNLVNESQPAMQPQPARPPADSVFLQQPMPQERGGQPAPMPRLQRGDVGMGEIPGFGQMPPREDFVVVSSSMLGNQASLIADITGEEPEMPRAPRRVFEPRPAPQMPAQIPTGVQPRVRPGGQILDRSRMMAEDRQSGARRDFEAEARERGEMVMADIESYVEPEMDYDYDVTTLAPAREARQAMRGRRRQRLAQQRERELAPMFTAIERRREVRRQQAEDEQLQQLLDDAGVLVEGANRYDRERERDVDRYDRERDFDRERDYE